MKYDESQALACMKKYFGYDTFRELQADIIAHVMEGGDALVLMPTGGGKSLCYQLPALLMEGTAVVVSPLISLMKDQVTQLRANGICAATLNSANTDAESFYVRRTIASGELKLLYISPERLLTELSYLFHELKVSLFAIDEAHCISHWGHDFRKEYSQLGVLKQEYPNTPIVALTATADKVTREDILQQLNIPTAPVFMSSFDRPNLSIKVRMISKERLRQDQVLDFVLSHPGECGIVYCLSRKTCETIASMLSLHGISVAVYHAGLNADERERAQQDFVNDRVQVICATIAFGMGINKSNVRFVVHYNLPKSIESYYQEIGRAGRDGVPSDTLLLYGLQDVKQLRKFAEESGQEDINTERLNRMVEYAQSGVCRRRTLLNYFGQSTDCNCGNCDMCAKPPLRIDGTRLTQMALSAVARTQQSATMQTVKDILLGTYSAEVTQHKWEQLPTFAVGRNVPAKEWEDYLVQMVQLGYLEIAYDQHNYLKITPQGNDVLYGRATATLCQPTKDWQGSKKTATPVRPKPQTTPSAGGEEDTALFEHLRKLRRRLAEKQGFPPYIVMSDKALHQMAVDRPATLDAFAQISGIGEFKLKKYGKVFTDAIRDYLSDNP